MNIKRKKIVSYCFKFIDRHWKILFVLFLGLTPLLWFKPGFIIAKGDNLPFVSPSINLPRIIYSWLDVGSLGNVPKAGDFSSSQTIWASVWYLLTEVGLPLNMAQIFLEVFYFLGAGVSMYFLASTVYKKEKITPLIASIFFMFNFLMQFRTFNAGVSWVLALLPLMLAFYVRIIDNLKNGQKIIKNSFAFVIISSILMSFATVNPALIALIIMLFVVVFSYSVISQKGIRFKIIKILVFLTTVCFLVNIWWIIPFFEQIIPYVGGSVQLGTPTDVAGWIHAYSRSSFLNLFWLNGVWSWTPEYVPYIGIYSNPILIMLNFLPMIVGFMSLLFKSKYRKINLYFAGAILVLMFLSKGIHPPLENISLLFYKYVPGFFLFREPFVKFYMILIIPLALLIGTSCNAIGERIKNSKVNHRKIIFKAFIIIIVSTFLISSFPLLTGAVVFGKTEQLPFSSYVNIPDYWYQASRYINNDKGNFRVLLTPSDDYYQMPYKWGYYGTDSLALSLIAKPVIFQVSGGYADSSNLTSLIYEKISKNESEGFLSLLSLLNIKYIMQRNDILWNATGRTIVSPEIMKSFLSKQNGITLVASYGDLDLYKVSDVHLLALVYSATNSVIFNGSMSRISPVVFSDDSVFGNSALFLSNQMNEAQDEFIGNLDITNFVNENVVTVMSQNGSDQPFNWATLGNNSIEMRYYNGWKSIIRTDGRESNDTLSFSSLAVCPYVFPAFSSSSWNAVDSTLVFIKAGDNALKIDQVLENGTPITDIFGIWWETGWEGMTGAVQSIQSPIVIPSGQRAIIQVGNIVKDNVTIQYSNATSLFNNQTKPNISPKLTFEEVNPTKYEVKIENASSPFFIVLGESFNSQWKAYVSNGGPQFDSIIKSYQNINVKEAGDKFVFSPMDLSFLLGSSLNEKYHFIANGYANSWYIAPQQLGVKPEEFTITFYYLPQSYNYLGFLVTGAALLILAVYIIYGLKGTLIRKFNKLHHSS